MVGIDGQHLSSLAPFLPRGSWDSSLTVNSVRSRLAFVHVVGCIKPLNAAQDDKPYYILRESDKPS